MIKLPKTIPAFLWYFIKLQRIAFIILFCTALLWSVNETLFPYFIKLIVNTIYAYKGNPLEIFTALKFPITGLFSIWLIMEMAMRTQGITAISAIPRFRANIREAVYGYVKDHSFEYFSNNFAGSIAKKLADLPNSCQTVVENMIYNFTSILVALAIAIFLMWLTSPLFATIMIAWFVIHSGITLIFTLTGSKLWAMHSEAVSTLSGKIVDSLNNIFNVHLFARGHYESNYLKNFQTDEMKKARTAMWHIEKMKIYQGIAALVLIMSMIFTLIHGWQQGWVTLGDFSLISMLSFSMLGMVWYLSYQMTIFVREIGVIKEALSLITASHGIPEVPNATALQISNGEICFNNVTFLYRKHKKIFERLSVTIPAGQKIGLVGFSGSGKSTFVNLILRFYDIASGEILIDNQNVAKVTKASLREKIAMIPQEPTLFHRTLMENIRYGRLSATDKEVIAASKLAHCQEFIKTLDNGYNELVGERGIKLSGGQRQRIAIARAILKNAPILILDEATSALDSVTEKLIQDSLRRLMKGKTTIVVAHRLSTLANMDRILVFDQGKIVEDGTAEELLNANGHFAKLWAMQVDGFLPDMD